MSLLTVIITTFASTHALSSIKYSAEKSLYKESSTYKLGAKTVHSVSRFSFETES